MRGNDFLEKMGLIDPAYVEAADTARKKRKFSGCSGERLLLVLQSLLLQQRCSSHTMNQNCPLTCRCCRFLKTLRVEWDMRDIWLMTFRNS